MLQHHLYEDHEHDSIGVRHAHKYDIALIELDQEIAFNSRVQPACLPASTDSFESKTCWLVGWGSTQTDGSSKYDTVQSPVGNLLDYS